MADNTTINPGAAGDVIRSEDRTGVKTQIVGLDLNPAGAESLMAGVIPVSDNGGSLTVDGTVVGAGQASSSSSVTNVAASATNVTLKASNSSRKALYIFNAGTSNLFVKLGATATATTSFSCMVSPNGFWELPGRPDLHGHRGRHLVGNGR